MPIPEKRAGPPKPLPTRDELRPADPVPPSFREPKRAPVILLLADLGFLVGGWVFAGICLYISVALSFHISTAYQGSRGPAAGLFILGLVSLFILGVLGRLTH